MNQGRYANDPEYSELKKQVEELKRDGLPESDLMLCTMSCVTMAGYGRGCAFRRANCPDYVGVSRNNDCPHPLEKVIDSLVPCSDILEDLKESEW